MGMFIGLPEDLLRILGANIETARLRRGIPINALCKRARITAQTYRRLRKGEKGVSLGVLANVLEAMGLENRLLDLINPADDADGIALEAERPPVIYADLDTNF